MTLVTQALAQMQGSIQILAQTTLLVVLMVGKVKLLLYRIVHQAIQQVFVLAATQNIISIQTNAFKSQYFATPIMVKQEHA